MERVVHADEMLTSSPSPNPRCPSSLPFPVLPQILIAAMVGHADPHSALPGGSEESTEGAVLTAFGLANLVYSTCAFSCTVDRTDITGWEEVISHVSFSPSLCCLSHLHNSPRVY